MNDKSDELLIEIIYEFFRRRDDYIKTCIKNTLCLIHRPDLYGELYSLLFEYIYENRHKLEAKICDDKIESIAIHWQKMQIFWRDTVFKKQYIYPYFDNNNKCLLTEIVYVLDVEDKLYDYDEDSLYEYKLSLIHEYINTQPEHIKQMFRYLEKGVTVKELSKIMKCSRSYAFEKVKRLKNDIKNYVNNYLKSE